MLNSIPDSIRYTDKEMVFHKVYFIWFTVKDITFHLALNPFVLAYTILFTFHSLGYKAANDTTYRSPNLARLGHLVAPGSNFLRYSHLAGSLFV